MKAKFKKIAEFLREHAEWIDMAGRELKVEYRECLELAGWIEGFNSNLLDFDEEKNISVVMSALGKKGGVIGGVKRAAVLSPERRKEIAQKAAKSRWHSVITHKIN